MDIRQNIWIHDADKFHVHSDGGIVDLTIRSNGRVTLNMSMERAERLYEVLGGFLESRGVPKTPWHAGTALGRRGDEPDGAADRRGITPAEAVTDDEPYEGPCLDESCGGELRAEGDMLRCTDCKRAWHEDVVEQAHGKCDHLGGDCRVLRRRERFKAAQDDPYREIRPGVYVLRDRSAEIVDADELLADMAASYDVRRESWEPDPGIGRQNCPEIVP